MKRLTIVFAVLLSMLSIPGVARAAVDPLAFSPDPMAFGTVAVGANSSLPTTVSYTTSVSTQYLYVGIDTATITGADAANFAVTGNDCSFINLSGVGYNETCSITVAFTPTTPGAKSASLDIAWQNTGGPTGNQSLSLTGTGAAAQCAGGSYSGSGYEPCTPAAAGYFVPVAGSTSQTACAPGSFSATAGQSSCVNAPAGSYASGTANTSATLCPAGTFSATAGQSSCTLAAIGSYVDAPGKNHQSPCPAGTFSATVGQSSCTSAPAGSFASGTGNIAATLCPTGTFSATSAQPSCAPAPAGKFASGTGNTSATSCPAGTYSPTTGQSSCTLAPTGSFASGTGNTSATLCPVGTFSATAGQSSCTPAGIGSYVPATGQNHQTACPAGTTTATTGSTSATACVPLYGLGGFISPLPRSTLAKSGSTIPVKFVLTASASSSTPLSPSVAAALAAAGKVKVTLAGPGINPQDELCRWNASGQYFQCNIKTPNKGLVTGASYTITVSELVGTVFVAAPAVGSTVNPQIVFFR